MRISLWRKSQNTFELRRNRKAWRNRSLLDFSKLMLLPLKKKRKHDGMKNHLGPKKEHNMFKNSDIAKGPKNGCYVCGKPRHYARDWRHNMSKNKTNEVHANDDMIATVSEIMTIKGKMQGCWYHTCVTIHVLPYMSLMTKQHLRPILN